MKDSVRLPVPRPLGLIRLDGPDVVRDAGPQLFDQVVGLVLYLGPGGGGPVSSSPVHLTKNSTSFAIRGGKGKSSNCLGAFSALFRSFFLAKANEMSSSLI